MTTARPISAVALTKRYGRGRGVEALSLAVERGEVFGFLGPNGAGKTTTIRLLLGPLRREGRLIADERIDALTGRAPRRVRLTFAGRPAPEAFERLSGVAARPRRSPGACREVSLRAGEALREDHDGSLVSLGAPS